MLIFFIVSCYLSPSLLIVTRADNVKSSCQGTGICNNLYECLPVLNQYKQNNTRPVFCSEEDEIVCCPVEIEMENARISEKKCLEYLEYVFEEVRTLPDDPEDDYEVAHIDRCGIQVQEYAIEGGEDASHREYPHMAAIGDNSIEVEGVEDYILWFCGGSLISENFVITAAHCIVTENTISPKIVKFGALNFDVDEPSAKTYEIEQAIAHPEYVRQFVYHDIGLLKLKENVKLDFNIRPICLPPSDASREFKSIWATGWGKKKGEGYEGILQKLQLPLVTESQCGMTYTPKRTKRLPNGLNGKILCYGAIRGKDTCPGSSGGPIQVTSRNVYCSYYLVGITSAGVRCTEGYPGLFTKVSEYLDWIEDTVWNVK
uniref:CSON009877 protein n=1 Tax=Culicoides sonorensis TaxID=179676 RepID=A0A336M6F9_CULSO